MPEPYHDPHPLLNRMGKQQRDSQGRVTHNPPMVSDQLVHETSPSGHHPLLRKSPWVRNAEANELPAKDTTNG